MEFWIRLEIVPGEGVRTLQQGPPTNAQRTVGRADGPQLLSVAEAAVYLGVSRGTIYRAIRSGRVGLTPIMIGKAMKLSKRQLDEWLSPPAAVPAKPAVEFVTKPRSTRSAQSVSSEAEVVRRFRVPRGSPAGSG